MRKKLVNLFTTAGLLLLPLVTYAQLEAPPPIGNLPGKQTSNVGGVLGDLVMIILGITGFVAVFFLVIGGFRYIVSAGNEDQAEAAKKTIINAIIGLVVVIMSYVIVTVVINELTV